MFYQILLATKIMFVRATETGKESEIPARIYNRRGDKAVNK